jgi:hypothetical protein
MFGRRVADTDHKWLQLPYERMARGHEAIDTAEIDQIISAKGTNNGGVAQTETYSGLVGAIWQARNNLSFDGGVSLPARQLPSCERDTRWTDLRVRRRRRCDQTGGNFWKLGPFALISLIQMREAIRVGSVPVGKRSEITPLHTWCCVGESGAVALN